MERTQRLLSIALAVLALDGCRGTSQQAATPGPTRSPGSSSHASHYHGGAGAGGFIGGAAGSRGNGVNGGNGTIDRTLGGKRGYGVRGATTRGGGFFSHFGRFGGFGHAGAHGFGG